MNVGIFHPQFWLDHGHWGYKNHTEENSGRWKSITYHINDPGKKEFDFIVIHENIDKKMRVRAGGGGFIFVTGEEKSIKDKYHQDFLNQFDCIITSRNDINHRHVIHTHYLHPWRI